MRTQRWLQAWRAVPTRWATRGTGFGTVLALAILAMSVGLIRSEMAANVGRLTGAVAERPRGGPDW